MHSPGHMREIRERRVGIGSLLLHSGFWGFHSKCQAWQQKPSPAEKSHQPPGHMDFFFFFKEDHDNTFQKKKSSF